MDKLTLMAFIQKYQQNPPPPKKKPKKNRKTFKQDKMLFILEACITGPSLMELPDI